MYKLINRLLNFRLLVIGCVFFLNTWANVSFCTREHFGRAQKDEVDSYIRLAYSGISTEDIEDGLIALKNYFEE